MFSSLGWSEIFFLLIIGLIVIGPERLPGVIEDVRAAIYAARKGIANAKRELNGEFEEFEEFRKPIDTVSRYAAMGPARAVSSLLFEGDDEFLESFDPRKVLDDDSTDHPTGAAGPRPARRAGSSRGGSTRAGSTRAQAPQPSPTPREQRGFNWEDVT